MLKGGQRVRKSERHDVPFIQAVAHSECCLPFVAISDSDQVIRMMKVNLGVDSGLSGGVEKVGGEWN
jgi:hypothetical protein